MKTDNVTSRRNIESEDHSLQLVMRALVRTLSRFWFQWLLVVMTSVVVFYDLFLSGNSQGDQQQLQILAIDLGHPVPQKVTEMKKKGTALREMRILMETIPEISKNVKDTVNEWNTSEPQEVEAPPSTAATKQEWKTVDNEDEELLNNGSEVTPTYEDSNEDYTEEVASDVKPLCPAHSPWLVGPVKVVKDAPSLEEQEHLHPELMPGGHHEPEDCRSRHKVAILIPYRNRSKHLTALLYHLHPILQRQQIDYTIFVVEQAGKNIFNKGMLYNIGALEALRHSPFTCFILHDVDLLMEDDRNLYTCSVHPRHLSVAVSTLEYKLPYKELFGGVCAIKVEQYFDVNGFSNKYWGWGGEDDDLYERLAAHHLGIVRYRSNISRFTMLSHKKETPNPSRHKYLNKARKRHMSDGLNTIRYHLLDKQIHRLYTWLYVKLLPL